MVLKGTASIMYMGQGSTGNPRRPNLIGVPVNRVGLSQGTSPALNLQQELICSNLKSVAVVCHDFRP